MRELTESELRERAEALPQSAHERGRGREADQPSEIPARGWRDVVVRVVRQLGEDNVSIVAAGLALFALLALFPALAAAVALYGFFSSPEQITAQIQLLSGLIPGDAMQILERQLRDLAGRQSNTLGVGAITAVLVSLWSARKGMVALMMAMNVAYNEREKRGMVRRFLISSAFTVGAVLGFILVALLGIAVPVVLNFVPLGDATQAVVLIARWALLWFVAVLGLAVVYRYAPSRTEARWQWISWGSAIAATLWLIGSLLFALFVRNFDTFGETYGAIGSVVVLLIWFLLSAFVIILGAEINSEMERQTAKDTTEHPEKPMGRRGAYSADTVGPST